MTGMVLLAVETAGAIASMASVRPVNAVTMRTVKRAMPVTPRTMYAGRLAISVAVSVVNAPSIQNARR